jgi:hypothetical protein
MNTRLIAVAALAALTLTGCATGTTETTEDAPAANESACVEFSNLTHDVATEIETQDVLNFDDLPAQLDEIALTAEGDVKERVLDAADGLPDTPHMIVWGDNAEAYTASLEAVQRACAADGHDVEVFTITQGLGG